MIEKGLCFSISSARSTGTVLGILDGLRLQVPIALFNGVIYYDYLAARFVRILEIAPQAAQQVALFMERYGSSQYHVYLPGSAAVRLLHQPGYGKGAPVCGRAIPLSSKKWRQVDSLVQTAEKERVVFFSMPGPKDKMDCLYAEMKKIPGITLSYYMDTYEPLWYLEIQAGGVDKRLSVEILREMTRRGSRGCFRR